MSSNESRWYVFGRKVPSTSTEVGPIEPGTVYVFEGWSRTKEAATARRDKLDRAGRHGIMVFSGTRQQAYADVMAVYDGVVVEGYISPANKRAGRQLVRAAVVRAIFCPYTGVVLDMRRAVVVDSGVSRRVMVATWWDKAVASYEGGLEAISAENKRRTGRPVVVYDGRELFKR